MDSTRTFDLCICEPLSQLILLHLVILYGNLQESYWTDNAPQIDYFAPLAGAVIHPQRHDHLESNFDQDFLPESGSPKRYVSYATKDNTENGLLDAVDGPRMSKAGFLTPIG